MHTISLIYFLLQNYLVPLIFVIGLLYFLYGSLQYFVLSNSGGEGEKQHGRSNLLTACLWLFVALVVFSIFSFFGWLTTRAIDISGQAEGGKSIDSSAGARFNSGQGVLDVPNTPFGNEPFTQ